ncbi:hypothetical protein KKB99_01610, partial [bacterium]|nr:hypothetical protein [bacterium]MBU1024683.1 hypothetical protein [bacterium]
KYFTARSLAGKKIDAGFSTIGFLHYCAREDRKKEQVNEFGYYYDFRYPETNFVFCSSHEILSDEMKKHDSFFDDDPIYKTDKLLIIDDFGAEFSSKGDWTSAVWDKVINHRYANELPTILTTNLTYPEIISKYNERITDRLNECAKFVVVNEKSYRVRNQAVKESKQLRNLDPNELEILLNEK